MCGLCMDMLQDSEFFSSRQDPDRTLRMALLRVYDQLQLQLTDELAKEDSCAKLVTDAVHHAKSFLKEVCAILLLAPTHLTETDSLLSFEPTMLKQSMSESAMAKVWESCGA